MRRFLNREKKYKLTEEEANKNAAKDRSVFWNIYICEGRARMQHEGTRRMISNNLQNVHSVMLSKIDNYVFI